MNQGLTQVDDGLGKLREAIATNEGITEDLAQKYGAHVLPIGKPTFLNLVDLIRGQIATAPDVALPQDLLDNLPAILKELAVATNSYVAQVGSANAGYAAPSLMALLLSILLRLQPVLNWGSLPTEDKVPSAVVRRYRDLQKAFEGLEEDLRNLSQHKDQAQKVLGGIESVMTAGQSFAQNLDQLKVDATTAAERAQAAATTSTSSLEQI